MIPLVGFLPADDPRVVGPSTAIERELCTTASCCRYRHAGRASVDGLPAGEGAFLPCTFWLADNLALQGRLDEARGAVRAAARPRNDVGLLSEEYDPDGERLLGNFPQAFTHVALVNTAFNLDRQEQRSTMKQRAPHDDPTAY